MSAVMEAREPSAKYLNALQPPLVQHFELMATAPGGVVKLRELILTLAVQGKLVPQDSNDEPARERLKQLQADRDPLGAKVQKTRDKLLSDVSEHEKLYQLPDGWEWVRLGEVVEVLDSFRRPVTKEDRLPGPYPYYGASGVVDYVSAYIFDEPLVLVGEDGAKWNAGDKTAFSISGKTWVNNHAHVLRPRRAVLTDLFLVNVLTAFDLSAFITGMTVPKLNQARLISIPFALPPLAEQSRIVARVEELMRLCDALEAKGQLEAAQHAQLVQTLLGALTASTSPDELADNWQRVAAHFDLLLDRPEAIDALEQTILQQAVRGLLVPQDPKDEPASELLKKIRAEKDQLIAEGKIKRVKPLAAVDDEEVPFNLPPGWTWARFPELGEFGRGKSKHRPRNDPALFQPPIYPVVQTGEVARAKGVIQEFHSKYSELGLAQSKLWPAGTLCITIAANIADAAALGFDACFPDSVVGFVPAQSIGRADYFLAFMETAKAHLTEFAPATAQKNINLEILGALLVPVPPLAEMSRIVARVESLRRLCTDLRQRLAARQATQAHLAEALIDEVA